MSILPVWARIAIVAALAAICFGAGWKVNGWRLETDLQALKTEHEKTISDAYKVTLAAQTKADADHQQLASKLAADSAAHHEDLTRSEHANDLLRASVASGTRVLRIAATCPASADPVPKAASGGLVDSGVGAVLDPATGQAVFDLRRNILATEGQLAACQAAARKLTGQ